MEMVALKQPSVKCVVENDIFRLNGLPNAKYGVFAWTQGTHTDDTESDFHVFSFSLFYVDRLRKDERNQVEVQSVAIETIKNVLKTLAEDWDWEIGEYNITTFNQRFKDVCAGAFAGVRIRVPVDSMCNEQNMGDFNNDFNDDFWTLVL